MIPGNKHLVRQVGQCQILGIMLMDVLGHKIHHPAVFAAAFPLSAAADDGYLLLKPQLQLLRMGQTLDFLGDKIIIEQILQHLANLVQTIRNNAPQLAAQHLDILRRDSRLFPQPAG
ncbi:hypothetical protein D3C75_809740 [compost metagenome]